MLCADVVVTKAERLTESQLKHLLGARSKWDLTGGDLFAGADDANDLRADALGRDVEALKHARSETFLFTQQAEQDVLGADVVVLQRAGLFLCEDDDLTGTLCKSLEHLIRVLPKSLGR